MSKDTQSFFEFSQIFTQLSIFYHLHFEAFVLKYIQSMKGFGKMLIVILTLVIVTVVLSPLLVALILMLPHISIVYKRGRMIKYITHAASESGFSVTHLHRLVCLSPNRADRYDLLVHNSERAYAIKLWSATKKQSTVVISRDGTVCECRRIPEPLSPDSERIYSIKGKKLSVPITKCNFKVKKGITVDHILMYYPRNKDTFLDFGTHKKRLGDGDRIFGKTVCSPTRFYKLLTSYNLPEEETDSAQERSDQ